MLKSVVSCALFQFTSPPSQDALGSLLSSTEQMHTKTYYLYLWTGAKIKIYGQKKRLRRVSLSHSGMRGSLRGGHLLMQKRIR